MKFTIAYHPVWEQTLTISEKEKYEQLLSHCCDVKQSISLYPILINQKKKGGLVATIFICNSMNKAIDIEETAVMIQSQPNNIVASGNFSPQLTIPPHTAMPWSFVFSPDQMTSTEPPADCWTVQFSPLN